MRDLRKRVLTVEPLESRRLLTAVNGDAHDRLDVNRDGTVSPLDALLILNVVNSGERSQAAASVRAQDATVARTFDAAYDVNLDGATSAADALMVINVLNSVAADVVFESDTPQASSFRAKLAGDFDADCDVDQQDYDLWASTFGSTTQLAADGNDNGVVDAADFTVWLDQRGARRCSSSDTIFWSLTNVEFDDRSLHANADGSVDLVLSTQDDIVWQVDRDGVSDSVTLKDVETGLYLGAEGFRVFMTSNLNDNARWRIIYNEDASVLFRNVATGRYFDGDGAADGWSVQESLATDADTRWKPNVWVLPESPSVSFAHIGDWGTGLVSTTRVAHRVNLAQPDVVLGGGDARYVNLPFDTPNGIYCDHQSNVVPGPKCPSGGNSVPNRFFAVPGNHDYTDGGGIEEYREYFDMPGRGATQASPTGSELFYDVVLGPVHLFALDSQAMRMVEGSYREQVDWLKAVVTSSTTPWQVVLIHHAPFTSSPTHGSDPIMQLPFANWGVDLVLGSHVHIYERIQRDGTTFVVNGLGGVSQYPLGNPIEGSEFQYNAGHGAGFFNATATTLEGSFVTLGGFAIDSFSVSQSVPGQPEPTDDLRVVGTAFVDDDGDRVRDVGESTLSNVVVFIDENRNNLRDAGEWFTTTNAAGEYEFFFAAPREYRLNVESLEGYVSVIKNSKRIDVFGPEPLVFDLGFDVEEL